MSYASEGVSYLICWIPVPGSLQMVTDPSQQLAQVQLLQQQQLQQQQMQQQQLQQQAAAQLAATQQLSAQQQAVSYAIGCTDS